MKTVFLFGHRDCPTFVSEGIFDAAEDYIKQFPGEDIRFIVGHRGDFDLVATYMLIVVKKMYTQVTLQKLIAYYDPIKHLYYPDEIDGTIFPEGLETVPKPFAIVKANNIMVNSCDAVICYVLRKGSNTYKLLRKAQRRGIPIVNLAETFPPDMKITPEWAKFCEELAAEKENS